MKAVILAPGDGRKLLPLTENRPKPMVRLANQPILEYTVDGLADAGIEEVILVVGRGQDRIRAYFGNGDRWNIEIEYAVQEPQLGTANALLQAEPFLEGEEEFLVFRGDRLFESAVVDQLVERRRQTGTYVLGVHDSDRLDEYDIVELTGDEVTAVDVESSDADAQTTLVDSGAYVFDTLIFDSIRPRVHESATAGRSIPDVLDRSVTAVRPLLMGGRRLELVYPWDLLAANATILEDRDHHPSSDRIHETAFVAPDVALAPRTTVGPQASVLRSVAIGEHATVGANAVLENSIVFPDATIESGAVVRDAIVGSNVTVGTNATIEGGSASVTVDNRVHEDVFLGGVVGDDTRVGGAVTLRPGTVVGNEVTATSGTTLSGRIDSKTTFGGS
ncbi:sugar phosphate nucleotidyltransferase [Natronoglomus mannanivorans]|uniref:Bifunctional protein GlmU n=1 Tax=Natronoglomus mannanivorans TaxID=2979990 RepID=A0AAP3E2N6_9EURY|nr:sugar phosphate nucleotidyltransferase [Halobacteria archaeon AArc-xg1-1]